MDAEKTLNHLSVKANYKRIHLFILAMVVSTSSVALAVRPEFDAGWSYSGLLLAALAVFAAVPVDAVAIRDRRARRIEAGRHARRPA